MDLQLLWSLGASRHFCKYFTLFKIHPSQMPACAHVFNLNPIERLYVILLCSQIQLENLIDTLIPLTDIEKELIVWRMVSGH